MPLEEDAAYAIASWKKFQDDVPNELLRAVCGAFAIVAAADGDVSEVEIDRLEKLLKRNADSFPALDIEEVGSQFRDLASAIQSDPDEGRRKAMIEIGKVKGNAGYEELVRSAARIAMAADMKISRRETVVIQKIQAAFDL